MLSLPSSPNQAGVDEVGRGCLFGDVVAAAVILPIPLPDAQNPLWSQIRDSKKLSKKKIAMVAQFIKEHAAAWAIGRASVPEIDQHNILQASFMAMHRALDGLEGIEIASILVDGNRFKNYKDVTHTCIPGADATHLHVACASILAKDTRDREIIQMVEENPAWSAYELQKNVGYGTKAHMEALRKVGPTPLHRTSFAPVALVLGSMNHSSIGSDSSHSMGS